MSRLTQVLEKFKNRLAYRKFDSDALNISRSLAAGSLGNADNFAQWASITNDPVVVVNYIHTYITTLVSKMSSAPVRPEDDKMSELGIKLGLNSEFAKRYKDTLNDGYAFVGVGVTDGVPVVKKIDARYIMFNGEDPTLKDATDVVVFEVVPLSTEEKEDCFRTEMVANSTMSTYVTFDPNAEKVRVSHYRKDEKSGQFVLDIYDDNADKPTSYPLGNIDRIPVVRFVGDEVELSDRRYHYRGIYFTLSSVMKAIALSATKVQTRVGATDADNYIAPDSAICNHNLSWANTGVKTVDDKDGNAQPISGIQFIPHDDHFLIESFNMWKEVISDMLGPTVASGSEAVTREEVKARQEVKDAISNLYLARIVDSIEEVYRCIKMLLGGDSEKVVIVGGFIEACKREKHRGEMKEVYAYAKEAGLNTQGIVIELTKLTDLPGDIKDRLVQTFKQDPYKSPLVMQLQQQLQQSQSTIQQLNQQIALLRIQATQRLERQSEAIESDERIKRLEIAQKQWQTEADQSQQARMEVLKRLLDSGDYDGARLVVEAINMQDPPIIADPTIGQIADANTAVTRQSVNNALASTGAMQNPQQQNQGGTPPAQSSQPQASITGSVPPNLPPQPRPAQPQPPRAAATLFTNA